MPMHAAKRSKISNHRTLPKNLQTTIKRTTNSETLADNRNPPSSPSSCSSLPPPPSTFWNEMPYDIPANEIYSLVDTLHPQDSNKTETSTEIPETCDTFSEIPRSPEEMRTFVKLFSRRLQTFRSSWLYIAKLLYKAQGRGALCFFVTEKYVKETFEFDPYLFSLLFLFIVSFYL